MAADSNVCRAQHQGPEPGYEGIRLVRERQTLLRRNAQKRPTQPARSHVTIGQTTDAYTQVRTQARVNGDNPERLSARRHSQPIPHQPCRSPLRDDAVRRRIRKDHRANADSCWVVLGWLS